MPIILTPITRRQFLHSSLASGSIAMMTSHALADVGSDHVGVDSNRLALLADTHISAHANRVYPGTKWPD